MTNAQTAVMGEIVDDAAYVTMRAIRLAMAMLARVYTAVWMGYAFKQLVSFGNPWRMWLTPWNWLLMNHVNPNGGEVLWDGKPCTPVSGEHWILLGLLFGVFSILSFALNIAFGLPYRYKSAKPGLGVYTCGACGVNIQDEWECQNCKGFRPARFFSLAMRAASYAITVVFVTWDILGYLVGMLVFIF